jgi:hypothetical protein
MPRERPPAQLGLAAIIGSGTQLPEVGDWIPLELVTLKYVYDNFGKSMQVLLNLPNMISCGA